jgi:hypothetical protein
MWRRVVLLLLSTVMVGSSVRPRESDGMEPLVSIAAAVHNHVLAVSLLKHK